VFYPPGWPQSRELEYASRALRSVVYVRLHGDAELYVSGYTDAALDAWARRVRRWAHGKTPAQGSSEAASIRTLRVVQRRGFGVAS